jgi:hypothetical protein
MTNLHRRTRRLVGREHELAEPCELLTDAAEPLVRADVDTETASALPISFGEQRSREAPSAVTQLEHLLRADEPADSRQTSGRGILV